MTNEELMLGFTADELRSMGQGALLVVLYGPDPVADESIYLRPSLHPLLTEWHILSDLSLALTYEHYLALRGGRMALCPGYGNALSHEYEVDGRPIDSQGLCSACVAFINGQKAVIKRY